MIEEPVSPRRRTAPRYSDEDAEAILRRATELEAAESALSRPAATLYTDEEAQEILSRAMGLRDQGMTRTSLVRMAQELGITPEELERAETDYRAGAVTQREVKEFVKEQWQELRGHLIAYAIVVTFLWLMLGFIALFVAREPMVLIAPIMVMLGWGIGIAFHVMYYLNLRADPEGNEEFEKWQEKEQRRLERRDRRRLRG